jgi:hypothetical protein
VWYAARPSRAIFVVKTRGDARLTLDFLDGRIVGDVLTEGRFEFDFDRDVFFRWWNGPSSTDSFASMRLVQRDNSLPYASQVWADFEPGDQPEFFQTIEF